MALIEEGTNQDESLAGKSVLVIYATTALNSHSEHWCKTVAITSIIGLTKSKFIFHVWAGTC